MIIICLNFFVSLNRGGSQNWWPRYSPAHCFKELTHKCFNLGGKSTAGHLPVKALIACRQILGNISFITLPIYIFVKNVDFFYIVLGLWPPFFSFFSSLFSLTAPTVSSFSSTKRWDFFWGQIIFCLPPSILSICPFPFFHTQILIPSEKAACKLYYRSHSHQLNLADKGKA